MWASGELSTAVSNGQVWYPYWQWEDHEAGMYGRPVNLARETELAYAVLADPSWAELAMRAVIAAWPAAAEHQLSNPRQNRRSWVGQAACRFAVDAAAVATRAAWARLTDVQRVAANACADRAIAGWEVSRA